MTATEVTCAVRSNGSRNETGCTANHNTPHPWRRACLAEARSAKAEPASPKRGARRRSLPRRSAEREGGSDPDDSRLADRGHLPQFVDDDFGDRLVFLFVD